MAFNHPWLLPLAIICVAIAIVAVRRARTPHLAHGDAGDREIKKWRCDNCRRSWYAAPGDRSDSRAVLMLKRRARRRARAHDRVEPSWARPTGSERCPSCASTDIRQSSRQ